MEQVFDPTKAEIKLQELAQTNRLLYDQLVVSTEIIDGIKREFALLSCCINFSPSSSIIYFIVCGKTSILII